MTRLQLFRPFQDAFSRGRILLAGNVLTNPGFLYSVKPPFERLIWLSERIEKVELLIS